MSRAGQRGFTIVEVAVATGLLAMLAVGAASTLVAGADACERTITHRDAHRAAWHAVETVASELRTAAPDSVVVSAARPDELTFRRVVGYDPSAPAVELRRLVSEPITYARVPLGARHPDLHAIERRQTGVRPARIAGLVAAQDEVVPAMPGFHVALRTEDETTFVDIAVTVAVQGRRERAVARATATVRLEAR